MQAKGRVNKFGLISPRRVSPLLGLVVRRSPSTNRPIGPIFGTGCRWVLQVARNLPALGVWRQVRRAETGLNRALGKLASGLRIAQASDDAAGLAISEKMRAQIRGLHQAVRNAQDAIALVQTAEGGMAGVQELVQRMRELAVQAATDTLTDHDREHIDREFRQLLDEISTTCTATQHNTKPLLDGSFQGRFQVGPKSGDAVALVIPDVCAFLAPPQSGRYVSVTDIAGWYGYSAYFDSGQGRWIIQDTAISRDPSGTQWDFLPSIGNDPMSVSWTVPPDPAVTYGTTMASDTGRVDGVVYGTLVFDATTAPGDEAYGTYRIDPVADFADGSYRVGFDGSQYVLFDGARNTVATSPDGGLTFLYAQSLGKDRLVFADPVTMGTVTVSGTTVTAEGNVALSVATRERAGRAMELLGQAIERLSSYRAGLGAFQNRLEHTVTRLLNTMENSVAALSRIRDADMAKEMMEFVRYQILLQSGTAMLAQANARPQAILRLLA